MEIVRSSAHDGFVIETRNVSTVSTSPSPCRRKATPLFTDFTDTPSKTPVAGILVSLSFPLPGSGEESEGTPNYLSQVGEQIVKGKMRGKRGGRHLAIVLLHHCK